MNDSTIRISPSAEIHALLKVARRAIETGENDLRRAAEAIAKAYQKGASQRLIASSIGKSAAWVNRLLLWRAAGYRDETAFGPQSKSSRERARVQATKRTEKTKQSREHVKTKRAHAKTRAAGVHESMSAAKGKARDLLVKALGMLGSDQAGERASAALVVEKQRVLIGMTWDQLIVRGHDDDEDLDNDDLDSDDLDDDDLDDEDDDEEFE